MTSKTKSPRVDAVAKTICILEELINKKNSGPTEIARQTNLNKSTVYRHLATLNNHGYVVKQGDSYHLSFRFLEFVNSLYNLESGYAMIDSKVNNLAIETGELVQFMIEEHQKSIFIYRKAGEKAVQIGPDLGRPIPLHTLAGGKAIIAQWSDAHIQTYVEEYGLSAHTKYSIVEYNEFMENITEIRDSGYALNDQESTEGLRAVGVSIQKPNDEVLGALSLSAPTNRLKGNVFTEKIPQLLKGTANEIELNLSVM